MEGNIVGGAREMGPSQTILAEEDAITDNPLLTMNDVVFGSGGHNNKIRKHSLYQKLVKDLWRKYITTKKKEKNAFVEEQIVAPILQAKGRFFLGNRQEFRELFWEKPPDQKRIRNTIAQKLRDVKGPFMGALSAFVKDHCGEGSGGLLVADYVQWKLESFGPVLESFQTKDLEEPSFFCDVPEWADQRAESYLCSSEDSDKSDGAAPSPIQSSTKYVTSSTKYVTPAELEAMVMEEVPDLQNSIKIKGTGFSYKWRRASRCGVQNGTSHEDQLSQIDAVPSTESPPLQAITPEGSNGDKGGQGGHQEITESPDEGEDLIGSGKEDHHSCCEFLNKGRLTVADIPIIKDLWNRQPAFKQTLNENIGTLEEEMPSDQESDNLEEEEQEDEGEGEETEPNEGEHGHFGTHLNMECISCDQPFEPIITRDTKGNFVADKRPVASRVCCHTSYCVDCFQESAALFPDKEWFRCSVCWKEEAMHQRDIWVNDVFCVLLTTNWNSHLSSDEQEPNALLPAANTQTQEEEPSSDEEVQSEPPSAEEAYQSDSPPPSPPPAPAPAPLVTSRGRERKIPSRYRENSAPSPTPRKRLGVASSPSPAPNKRAKLSVAKKRPSIKPKPLPKPKPTPKPKRKPEFTPPPGLAKPTPKPKPKKPRTIPELVPQIFPQTGRGGSKKKMFTWEDRLGHLEEYKRVNGHIKIPTVRRDPYYTLGLWLAAMRSLYKQNKLKKERLADLRKLGCYGFGGPEGSEQGGAD